MNRKFALSLYLLLSFIALNSVAQFRMGPTGGLNFNRQVFKSNTYRYDGVFKSRLGYNIGIVTDLVVTPHLSLQTDVVYSHKGGYYKTERLNIAEEFTDDLGYLEVPVCLILKKDVKSAFLFVGAGPYLSKLLYSHHTYTSNGYNIENGPMRVGTNYETDQLKPWDAGIKFKAGFELKKGFTMNAFYDVSTTDINPQFTVTRNKTFGIQLAYIFSLSEEDRYNRFENFYEF